MSAREFVAGDVVVLKSGGPPMTVQDHAPDGVRCLWFDEAEMCSGTFVEATLRPLNSEGTPSESREAKMSAP